MAKAQHSAFKKVAQEIRQEARRQLRGFPLREAKRQLTSGWADTFFGQIFGHSPGRRHRGR